MGADRRLRASAFWHSLVLFSTAFAETREGWVESKGMERKGLGTWGGQLINREEEMRNQVGKGGW